jgi:hypothetical protein
MTGEDEQMNWHDDEMLRQAEAAKRPRCFDLHETTYLLTLQEALDLMGLQRSEFDTLPLPYIGKGRAKRYCTKNVFEWIWRNRTLCEGWEAQDLLGFGPSHKDIVRASGERDDCTTYFIGAGETTPHAIKIGKAKSPLTRIDELQIGTHHDLKIWAIRRGNFEADYHRKYHKHRIRGEWFYLSWEMAHEIRNHPYAEGVVPCQ